jgi:guanine deaminase
MLLLRGRIFTPVGDPFERPDPAESCRYHEDGFVAVDDDGVIAGVGEWSDRPAGVGAETEHLDRRLLLTPGLIDTHLHAPQLEMIGSYGGHLLEWLERSTYPTESKFASEDHARAIATDLFDELLRNGTTTTLIFSSVHTGATDIFFEEADRRGLRAIIGKSLMDRNAPPQLLQDADAAYADSKRLIAKWHGRGALSWAVSPRFAPTCSPELLAAAGRLVAEHPGVYVHTHVSENHGEVAWVRELFPEDDHYVGVYGRFGLLGPRSVLAHGVHLSDAELTMLRETGTRISHCPNSNLFLGSGLFPLKRVRNAGVTIGLGSDIGAGTTPSMFSAMADAYMVQQVQGVSLTPLQLWYLATLGGARTLSCEHATGSLEAGKDADLLVLDTEATPLLARRTREAVAIGEVLAGLIFMGDDRCVHRVYIRGRRAAGA